MASKHAHFFHFGIDNLKNDPLILISHLPNRRDIC